MEKKGVIIGGIFFRQDEFDFLMTRFKKSFSHASLSVEMAFEKLYNIETELKLLKNQKAYEYFLLLDRKTRKTIDNYLKQFIVFYGCNSGEINLDFNPSWSQKEVDDIFNSYYKKLPEDPRESRLIIKYYDNGNFDKINTFREYGKYFRLMHEEKEARDTAYNMQKDHMDAFDYAMSLGDIGIKEIVDINEKVNYSNPEKEIGFKSTNNTIIGAEFEPTDKTLVPAEMQRLFADYKNNFGLEMLDYNEIGISHRERLERLKRLFEKEAIFHIRLMKIHPFNDGNGRTGRIIMNKHLLEKGMAPVLITDVMKDEYKEYIASGDFEKLALMMFSSSSQVLSNWDSMRDVGLKPKIMGETNAKLAIVPANIDKKSKTKALAKFRGNIFKH